MAHVGMGRGRGAREDWVLTPRQIYRGAIPLALAGGPQSTRAMGRASANRLARPVATASRRNRADAQGRGCSRAPKSPSASLSSC